MLRALFVLCLSVLALPAFGRTLELKDSKDFVRLVGEINESTVSQFIPELTVAAESSRTVTVYIDSPGGSIGAGLRLLDAVDGLRANSPGLRLRCYAQHAASMAFIFLQVACDFRIVSQYSVLMQHQASLGMQGKWGEVQSRAALVKQLVDILEIKTAARLKLPLAEYRARVANDWWLVGETSLREKAADFIGTVSCSVELVKSGQCPLFSPSNADGRSRAMSVPGVERSPASPAGR